MLIVFRFSSFASKTLKAIKTAKTEDEVYKVFLKRSDAYTPELFLLSLKQLRANKSRMPVSSELKKAFEDSLIETCAQLQQDDKWRFYVSLSQHGGFKEQVRTIAAELVGKSVRQVAILLWGLSRNGIKKPRLCMRMIDSLQGNIDKFTLLGIEDQKPTTENEENDEEEDVDLFYQNDQSKEIENYNYRFRDLVLILWAVREIRLENKSFMVFTFKTALTHINDQTIINTRSLILLLQATLDHRTDKEINTYQKNILDHLSNQGVDESVLIMVQLIHALGKLKSHPELAQKVALQILKKQSSSKFAFSSKFISVIVWNLNKLGIHDTSLYSKFGSHLLKANIHKPMDVSQNILVYLVQFDIHPEFTQYIHIIKSLITKANQMKLDTRSQDMIRDSLTKYRKEYLSLYKK